jgi:putative membrane protein
MNLRTLKVLSLAFAGVAGLSLPVSAAGSTSASTAGSTAGSTPAITPTSPNTTTSTPGVIDSLGNRKAPNISQTTSPGATAPGATATDAATAAATFTDAEIMGMVNTVDKHEIDAANKALKEKMGTEAQGYAKMLKEQHTANMDKTKALGKTLKLKAKTNQAAKDFHKKGEAEVKALSAKDGSEFEKGYIEAMVNGHTEVLQMLDTQLIPAAQNEALKTHLTEVRGHVSAHLEQGKRLQQASASRVE